MYPEEMVKPMRTELSDAGFQDLYNATEVENALKAGIDWIQYRDKENDDDLFFKIAKFRFHCYTFRN